MTIKKRLFWSNVLMILIPILLSILLTAIAINLVLDRMGLATTSHADSNLFYKVIVLILFDRLPGKKEHRAMLARCELGL